MALLRQKRYSDRQGIKNDMGVFMNRFGFCVILVATLLSGAAMASDLTQPAPGAAVAAETAARLGEPKTQPQPEEEIVADIQKAVEDVALQPSANTQPMPKVIADAAARGVQVQYLGDRDGYSGWILLDKAGATYNYVSPDGNTIFQGMMYDGAGTPLTLGQIAAARKLNPTFFSMAGPGSTVEVSTQSATGAPAPQTADPQTPGEQLYYSLGYSNVLKLGNLSDTAPVLYAFLDPDCGHCHDFLKEINKDYLVTNAIQLRVIPIGLLNEDSKRRAAYALAQADGAAQFLAHALGQKTMPAPEGLTLDGQQLNLDLFKHWRFDGTPILVYKEASGRIMMVRGGPKDMKSIVNSIAKGTTP